MKFPLSGHLYITNTSHPNKHNPVHFLDHFQKRGLHFFFFFNPAPVPLSFLTRPLSFGGNSFCYSLLMSFVFPGVKLY